MSRAVLTDLHVRDLGVIEDLTLVFGPGMTALTGETGAGKTLVVEALQLVLGGRANPGMVRAGAAEALVEARFVVGDGDAAREVILARSVPAEGRSRAWVDGRMAPARRAGRGGGGAGRDPRPARAPRPRHARPRSATSSMPSPAPTSAGSGRCAASCARSTRRWPALGGDAQQRAREADVLRYQVDEIAGGAPRGSRRGGRAAAGGGPPGRRRRPTARPRSTRPSWSTPAGEGGALDLLGRAAERSRAGRAFDGYRARLAAAAGRAVRRGPHAARRGRGLGGRPAPPGRRAGAPAPAGASCGASTARTWPPSWPTAGRAPPGWPRSRTPRARPPGSQAEQGARRAELAEAEAAVRAVPRPGRRGVRRARWASGWAPWPWPGPALEVRVAPEGTGEPVELAPRRQRGRAGAAAGPGRLGRRAGPGHAGHPPGGAGRPPDHGLRRGGRRRGRRGRAGPGRGAARGRPRHARCWSSPTWPRWRRRPTRRSAWSKASTGGRTVTTATTVQGEDAGRPSCPGCSRGTPTATPPGPTPVSCSGAAHGAVGPPRVRPPFDYRGRVHRSPDLMLGAPKAA